MNPQQPTNPIGPPPSPIGPDMVVPQSSGLPEVNITENSSPQYDPNYIPANPANSVSSPEMLNTSQPNSLPSVAPAPAPIQAPMVNPVQMNNNTPSSNNGELMRRIAMIVGALLLLGLLIFAVWWLFLRGGGDKTAVIEETTPVERNVNGISYEFAIPNGSSENKDAELDISEPIDNFAFSRSDDNGDLEFAGNSFVRADAENESANDIYDDSYKSELVGDVESAYGLSSISIGDPVDFTSDNLTSAVTAEITGQGREGVEFNGRVLTTVINEKAYNFFMVAPVEDWQANTSQIDNIYNSFKVNDDSGNPQIQQTGDELDVDLFVSVKEVAGPGLDGVDSEDVLEYEIEVKNSGPDTVKASSAEVSFAVGSEIVEIVALNDLSDSFDCDTAVGERTSVTGEMSCDITTDLEVDESVVLNVRYKHISEFNAEVEAKATLSGLVSADWADNDSTDDDSDARSYAYATKEQPDTTTEEPVDNTPDTPVTTTESLPDTAGGEDVALIAPLIIALVSALALVSSGSSKLKLNRK